jgi:uncharacterized membrane protein
MSRLMPTAADEALFRLRRSLLAASAVLTIVGVCAALYLTDLHVRVHTDASYQPACDINAVFRCSDIALSPYSHVFGVPMSVWALVGCAAFLFLQLWGLAPDSRHRWPAGLYWLLSAGALLVTLGLAYVAEFLIGAWCLGCIALYVVNLGLFVIASWLLWRDRGAVQRDLRGLPSNRPALALAGLLVLVSAGLVSAFPRYWLQPPQSECNGLPTGVGGDGSCWIGAREPVLEITEFSDYLWPTVPASRGTSGR